MSVTHTKSLTNRLFTTRLVWYKNKRNITYPHYWVFAIGITDYSTLYQKLSHGLQQRKLPNPLTVDVVSWGYFSYIYIYIYIKILPKLAREFAIWEIAFCDIVIIVTSHGRHSTPTHWQLDCLRTACSDKPTKTWWQVGSLHKDPIITQCVFISIRRHIYSFFLGL